MLLVEQRPFCCEVTAKSYGFTKTEVHLSYMSCLSDISYISDVYDALDVSIISVIHEVLGFFSIFPVDRTVSHLL